jgi:hypothetical protein
MKTIKFIISVMMFMEISARIYAQDTQKSVFENTTTKRFTFAKQGNTNVLVIDNLNGNVDVGGSAENEVVIEIKQKISAKNEAKLAIGKQESTVQFEQSGDSIIAYVPRSGKDCCKDAEKGWSRERFFYQWNDNDYESRQDFKVSVPKNTNLYLRTVNKGDIKVANIDGQLMVSNINGGIILDKIAGITSATTVNGKVTVTYTANPPQDSEYKTLNGTITVNYQENLSADLTFKSMHGEFYTDFKVAEYLNSIVEKREDSSGDNENKKKYKISSRPAIRIGKGGAKHSFESLNGDIYVKKIK